MKLGFVMLAIGVVVLLIWLVVSGDAEQPRCGGERMSPGEWCSSRKSGPSSFEEKQESAAAVAFWLLRLGAILALGGLGVLVGERVTRKLRTGTTPWARARERRAAKAAAAARTLPERVSPRQLAREVRKFELPVVPRLGYSRQEVDGLVSRIVAGLEGKGPAVDRREIVSFLSSPTLSSPGYDSSSARVFLTNLFGLMGRT
ncbi:hypothetical protein [Nonomuraea dietziae]|uniref:hypothetical protein n=1 Tax=Nonomuraea dietziae TaxID=65515 RepID=UPI0033ED5A77